MAREENRTVYSTETGRMCPNCGKPVTACVCKQKRTAPRGDGVVRVWVESKGRRGKTVTLVTGLALNDDALHHLASDLKRICGAGGAIKEGVIEIQGDHRDTVLAELKKQGIQAKRAGG